jgi:glycosyltransferase involved in cell wall biosynthesis
MWSDDEELLTNGPRLARLPQVMIQKMTTNTPLVSVGMPVYNGEEWIAAAIESILNQTYRDFELVISDNNSSDATEEICRRYADSDSRIKYFRQPVNIGASPNYNFVFRAASAPYFKWASSNDICHETFLELCVAELESRPDLAVCHPRTRLFVDHPDDGEDYFDDMTLLDDSPCQRFKKFGLNLRLNNVMNGVIKRGILEKTSLIKSYYCADKVLMAEVSLHGKFAEVPTALFFRRMDEKTSTRLMSENEVREHIDPQKKSLMLFQNWHLQVGYVIAALRAPLKVRERACVLSVVLREVWWNRGELAADVREAFQTWTSRTAG